MYQRKKKLLDTLCEKCQKNKPEKKSHTCAYRVEINEDKETLCNCCRDCTARCAENV